jgi:hypothetical protein
MLGAEARDSDISAHASGDAARGVLSLLGKLVALPYALPGELISGTGSSTGTADTALMAALGAGTQIYVTSIQAANSSATDTLVHIKDGSTTLMTLAVPANGGAEAELPSPLRLTANTALNFASTTAVTTLYVSYHGYQAAE